MAKRLEKYFKSLVNTKLQENYLDCESSKKSSDICEEENLINKKLKVKIAHKRQLMSWDREKDRIRSQISKPPSVLLMDAQDRYREKVEAWHSDTEREYDFIQSKTTSVTTTGEDKQRRESVKTRLNFFYQNLRDAGKCYTPTTKT